MKIETVKTYALVIISVLMVSFAAFGAKMFYDLQDEKIKLTAKDAQIQRLDVDLGIAESSLTDAKSLNEQYEQEIAGFPKDLQEKLKEYDLKLKSRDQTIAALRNKIKGGKTTVDVGNPIDTGGNPIVVPEDCPAPEEMVIGYAWRDDLGRFHLSDPNIFVEGNEEFTSQQHLMVVGHVFYGKDGQLQVKKIEVREVVPSGLNSDGTQAYERVPDAQIEIVDAQFEYTNELTVPQRGLLDVFTLRPFASFDSALTPGLGLELMNLGRLIDYANVGLNAKLAVDLSDPLGGSLQGSRVGIGLNYQLIPPLLDTNLSLGIGLSTPFNHFASSDHWVLTLDAIFYLTPDLNPFSSREN